MFLQGEESKFDDFQQASVIFPQTGRLKYGDSTYSVEKDDSEMIFGTDHVLGLGYRRSLAQRLNLTLVRPT
jgi:hypothetical protein